MRSLSIILMFILIILCVFIIPEVIGIVVVQDLPDEYRILRRRGRMSCSWICFWRCSRITTCLYCLNKICCSMSERRIRNCSSMNCFLMNCKWSYNCCGSRMNTTSNCSYRTNRKLRSAQMPYKSVRSNLRSPDWTISLSYVSVVDLSAYNLLNLSYCLQRSCIQYNHR